MSPFKSAPQRRGQTAAGIILTEQEIILLGYLVGHALVGRKPELVKGEIDRLDGIAAELRRARQVIRQATA